MGQEYTCPELQYKVPSVLVKVLTPSKQMENAMNIMKIWEKLQKKKKKKEISLYFSACGSFSYALNKKPCMFLWH